VLQWLVTLVALSTAPATFAGPAATENRQGELVLRELNAAAARLAERASPAVVQVQVTGFGASGERDRAGTTVLARQHGLGSGVVVDAAGYVLTNFHVVHGAQRIVVVLPPAAAGGAARGGTVRRRRFEAVVVGADRFTDLALLKIEATGLPVLPLSEHSRVRQGELVFAIGSPEGLESTVTMGVVGAAARQVQQESAMTFIQTDAPINPGNSGGALVDVEGRLVGINTFILSDSGGSQGLGFAIPAPTARFVYDSLRKWGRVRRVEVGVAAQPITPPLAKGLGLSRDWGVLVDDVTADGAAKASGLQGGDVIDQVDGHPIDSPASLTEALYLHPMDQPVKLDILRGDKALSLLVNAPEAKNKVEALADLVNTRDHFVRRLGILGLTVSNKLEGLVHLRNGTGVIVAARTLDATSVETGLEVGDVIHEVNRAPVESLEALRGALRGLKAGDALVLLIERHDLFQYLAAEME
jgi:serine protease Do